MSDILEAINAKINEGGKIELHHFLVTSLNDTPLEERDLYAAIQSLDKCATVANIDNMPCVYLDWRGLAALASEHMNKDDLLDMKREDWEAIGAGVKFIMAQELDSMFTRISQVLKEEVLPKYLEEYHKDPKRSGLPFGGSSNDETGNA